jgi:hypothetical protein
MMKNAHDSFLNSMQFNPNTNKAHISDALEMIKWRQEITLSEDMLSAAL